MTEGLGRAALVEALEPVGEALEPVGEALDYWAWRRLADSNDKLATAVATAVAAGAPPETIRRYVVNRTGRAELASFVEQAARWLAANP